MEAEVHAPSAEIFGSMTLTARWSSFHCPRRESLRRVNILIQNSGNPTISTLTATYTVRSLAMCADGTFLMDARRFVLFGMAFTGAERVITGRVGRETRNGRCTVSISLQAANQARASY